MSFFGVTWMGGGGGKIYESMRTLEKLCHLYTNNFDWVMSWGLCNLYPLILLKHQRHQIYTVLFKNPRSSVIAINNVSIPLIINVTLIISEVELLKLSYSPRLLSSVLFHNIHTVSSSTIDYMQAKRFLILCDGCFSLEYSTKLRHFPRLFLYLLTQKWK